MKFRTLDRIENVMTEHNGNQSDRSETIFLQILNCFKRLRKCIGTQNTCVVCNQHDKLYSF